MIVRNLEEARKTDRLVTAENGNWDSTRLVLANDNAGFSFHITRIFPGTETHIHYKNHYEAVFCNDENARKKPWPMAKSGRSSRRYLSAGSARRHLLRVKKSMTDACVFTPAITGTSTPRKNGSYAAPTG
uniref:L-ectoine synthase n=1 Tax=Halomonas sp. BYS-1 TaxID=179977 RepID=Q4U321_9GAMM|nr:ectoine synthase [Halomonas sp. BYS-1]